MTTGDEAPAGAAPDGLEQARWNAPRLHFAPRRNWMNDPNGLVHVQGAYHLFFQYNPHGDTWGHMSWGHAISEDLVHWRELGVAIPEAPPVAAFSGSAVVDWRDTSGLGADGRPPVVALFTGADMESGLQAQRLAYSQDDGRRWTVLDAPVLDIGATDFRDPKVFWHAPTGRWIMVVARADQRRILVYSSPDLRAWTPESAFGPVGDRGRIWECPDLFPLPLDDGDEVVWVMVVSFGDNRRTDGSGVEYFIGIFDGRAFEPLGDFARAGQLLDHGADFYAPQTWSDMPASDARRILMGWAGNWTYAAVMPTAPARGTMGFPRELSATRTRAGVRLRQHPVAELERLRREGSETPLDLRLDAAPTPLTDWTGDGLELDLDVDLRDAGSVSLELEDRAGGRIRLELAGEDRLVLDRTACGGQVHDDFPGRRTATADLRGRPVRLRAFVDRSVLEVFVGDGEVVFTERFFLAGAQLRWVARAAGPARLVGRSWRLAPAHGADSVVQGPPFAA